jgi:hypothetical protein
MNIFQKELHQKTLAQFSKANIVDGLTRPTRKVVGMNQKFAAVGV